ncbi:MAG TPA: LamG-like jellyroll fold domain-containing protein [Verrucomicrobiae bacterium]|jgi:hypothetical protein|nr:LamG-like jellyroll fold domain-containing protein [Verrucomicrobiae bacterium]
MKTQKNPNLTVIRMSLLMAVGIIAIACAPVCRAGLMGPYTNDFYTLHLWHMDDVNGTPLNAPTNALNIDVTTNPQTRAITESNTPGEVNESQFSGYPPTEFALQGQQCYTNLGLPNDFGSCVETFQYSYLYPPFVQLNPSANGVQYTGTTNLSDFISTNTGAYTIECLINPQFNPTANASYREIICGDSGNATPERGWLFRFNNANGIEFNCGPAWAGSVNHDVSVKLPTTGPDAAVEGSWYHLAVTYTGFAPTNGDTAGQFRIYWTLMDPTRTHDDLLFITNNFAPMTNTEEPVLVIGGSGRDNPINGVGSGTDQGLPAYIDEVRISDYCRGSNDLMFNTNGYVAPPGIGIPQTNYVVGYGQTLTISSSETGTTPITNQWYQNGVALPGQTNAVLTISNLTFAAVGSYQLFATNAASSASGPVCLVRVGAAFNGLFNSGVDANGNALWSTSPGSIDLHYQLVQSSDSYSVGSNAYVNGQEGGGVATSDSASGWIDPEPLGSGNGNNGTYSYQTEFQIDNGDPASATVLGNLWATGPAGGNTFQIFVNGHETDVIFSGNPLSVPTPFVLTSTNGLQAGSNTLVFTMNANGATPPGYFRVAMTAVCTNALPASLPLITNEPPASQTVLYGATAAIPSVALGRPPLSYQWYSNGVAIFGATSQDLSFVATNLSASQVVGGQITADYNVVVSNDSGSVTSSVDALTIQIPPLTVASAGAAIWSSNTIVVYFSSAVDPVTSTSAGNYLLDNGASVLSAAAGTAPGEVILTTTVLNPGTSYNLTVQNVNSVFGFVMNPSPSTIAVGTYPTVALWVKSNSGVIADGNGNVSQWNDLSANGNNLFTGGSDPLLVPNAIDGQPMVEFAATNGTYLYANDATSLKLTGDMSIFAVVNFATLAGGTNGDIVSKVNNNNQPAPYDYYAQSGNVHFLRGNGSGNVSVNSTTGPSTGVPHILDVVMRGTSVTHRLDGNSNGSGTLSTAIVDQGQPLSVGARQDFRDFLSGGIAELIVVGQALSSSDVASMESYLGAEYNLPLGISLIRTNIVTSVANNQLTLSWPKDHQGWQLQAQTNDASVGLSTNWVNVAGTTGTNQVVIPINLTNGTVFYRLTYP